MSGLPFTPVVRAGEWLIVSGQLGLADNELVDGGVLAQTRQALANMAEVLASEGASLADVVKANVFLIDMRDYDAMNIGYVEAFGEKLPARTAVAVAGLPRGGSVEIEAWARVAK